MSKCMHWEAGAGRCVRPAHVELLDTWGESTGVRYCTPCGQREVEERWRELHEVVGFRPLVERAG